LKQEGNCIPSKIQGVADEKCLKLDINEDTLAFMKSLTSADEVAVSRSNEIAHKLWTVKISNEMPDGMEMFMLSLFEGFNVIPHLVEILHFVLRARL
jgi:hypothetical protein